MRTKLILLEKELGLSAKEMAEKIGITQVTYSLIKNCKGNPSLETIDKFKKAFPDVDILELLKKY